jgi:hypothetical protein
LKINGKMCGGGWLSVSGVQEGPFGGGKGRKETKAGYEGREEGREEGRRP